MIYRDKEDFLNENNELINIDNIKCLVLEHEQDLTRLKSMKSLYSPKYNLLNKEIYVNHAKEIVDLACSYTFGMPINYSNGNVEALNDWFIEIDEDSHNYELGKNQSVYGKGYELVVFDDDNYLGKPMPYLANLSPLNTFIVEDNTFKHKPFIGIYYTTDLDMNGLIVAYNVTLYTDSYIYTLRGTTLQGLSIVNQEAHQFGSIPLIQLSNNAEEVGDFQYVVGLIIAYNILQNNRCIDKQQFVDKLLLIINSSLGDNESEYKKAIQHLKEYGILELTSNEGSTADARYISQIMTETEVEVLKKSISNDLHKIAKIPDMTDEQFSGNSSGIALAYKLFNTEQLAGEKERQFRKLLRKRFALINSYLSIKGYNLDLSAIDIKFKRNVPDNLDDKIKELQATDGVLPLRTRIVRFDGELDPDEQIKQLLEEKKQLASIMSNAYDNYNYNGQSDKKTDLKTTTEEQIEDNK